MTLGVSGAGRIARAGQGARSGPGLCTKEGYSHGDQPQPEAG